MILIV